MISGIRTTRTAEISACSHVHVSLVVLGHNRRILATNSQEGFCRRSLCADPLEASHLEALKWRPQVLVLAKKVSRTPNAGNQASIKQWLTLLHFTSASKVVVTSLMYAHVSAVPVTKPAKAAVRTDPVPLKISRACPELNIAAFGEQGVLCAPTFCLEDIKPGRVPHLHRHPYHHVPSSIPARPQPLTLRLPPSPGEQHPGFTLDP